MIRHRQAQSAMADAFFVVELQRVEHGLANIWTAQLVFPWRHAVDRDEKPTAVS
jgi:hypothetical protein